MGSNALTVAGKWSTPPYRGGEGGTGGWAGYRVSSSLMNAGAAYAYPCASPGAGGLSCAAAARGYQASTISAMLQMRGDRTVFISLLLLRSEDHEGREYPTPRARAGLSRKRPDATSARGSGQAEGSQRPRRRNRRCANSSGEESERGRYRA